MGNENDKRLNKSTIQNRNNNSAAQSQKLVNQNININQQQNERINPYDQSKKQQNNNRQIEIRGPEIKPMNYQNQNAPFHRSLTSRCF